MKMMECSFLFEMTDGLGLAGETYGNWIPPRSLFCCSFVILLGKEAYGQISHR